jgi:DedD protein
MICNQRGGILSAIFLIPIGIAVIAGFFFLGYYIGKHQSKTNPNEIVVPLPEVVSKNLPEKEEYTFYKTLTEKGSKTVSIELKTKTEDVKSSPGKKMAEQETGKNSETDLKTEKMPQTPKEGESKQQIPKNEPRLLYTLQIASYQEKAQADADAKKLKQKGYAAFVKSVEVPGKGTWYRVRLGSFSNRISAEKLQKELKAKAGITPFVTIE